MTSLHTAEDPQDGAGRSALHEALRRLDPIGALILDFDGVLTDDRVLTFADGTEAVRSSRRDGMGIQLLREIGLPMVVISKERNPVTVARCAKLGLEVFHGIDDKVAVMTTWLQGAGISAERCIYVGNDVNDLACMHLVGCSMAPADAHPEALAMVDVVLGYPGGDGAVRQVADAILALRRDASAPRDPKGSV